MLHCAVPLCPNGVNSRSVIKEITGLFCRDHKQGLLRNQRMGITLQQAKEATIEYLELKKRKLDRYRYKCDECGHGTNDIYFYEKAIYCESCMSTIDLSWLRMIRKGATEARNYKIMKREQETESRSLHSVSTQIHNYELPIDGNATYT